MNDDTQITQEDIQKQIGALVIQLMSAQKVIESLMRENESLRNDSKPALAVVK